MSALPLLLLGGVALLVMSKKKSAEKVEEEDEEVIVPQIPPRPDAGDEPDIDTGASTGPKVGDTVDSGVRRDRTGAHTWRVLLGENGYIAQDLPIGSHGPKDDLGEGETVGEAKKILSDFYNAALVDAGWPNEAKEDPGPRRMATAAAATIRNR